MILRIISKNTPRLKTAHTRGGFPRQRSSQMNFRPGVPATHFAANTRVAINIFTVRSLCTVGYCRPGNRIA